MDKLLLQSQNSKVSDKNADDYGNLISYTATNLVLSEGLEYFFKLASLFNAIPQSSQAKIQESLQSTQRYLYNQGGNIDNSFEVGDYTISFDTDPLFDAFWHYSFRISYQNPNNLLVSLSSNFDSSQAFLEFLEQRDKLEQQNQELKEKEKLIASGISQNTSIQTDSDSLMQTLLREAKENKEA